MDLKEAALLGDEQDTHWYYAAKSAALLRCVAERPVREILDVGAGSGFFAKVLLRDTPAQSATCVDIGYEREWLETFCEKSIQFRRCATAAGVDLILLMDVLEHVDDDVALLREYADSAPVGARFVVTVPAFSCLWSAHDTFLEHRRRYTLRQLTDLMVATGLKPKSGFYFYGLLFPIAAARRLWHRLTKSPEMPRSDLRRHHRWVNALLTNVCLAETRVAQFNSLFGLTAFALAEKVGRAGSGRQ